MCLEHRAAASLSTMMMLTTFLFVLTPSALAHGKPSSVTGRLSAHKQAQREALHHQLQSQSTRRQVDDNCTDSASWYKKGDTSKTCEWVGSIPELVAKRQYVKGWDGSLAMDACPMASGRCDEVLFPSCPSSKVLFEGDGKNDIFDPLSVDEINSIFDAAYDAGLVDVKHWYEWRFGMEDGRYPYSNETWNKVNWMGKVELAPPPKVEALAYLEADGPKPARMASFWLYRGARMPRDSVLYTVGPLPISEETTFTQQTELTPDDSIPWPARPYDGGEDFYIISDMVESITSTLDPLIQAFLAQMDSSHEAFVAEWTHPDVTASDPNYSRIFNGMFWTVVDDLWPAAGGVIKPFPLSFTYNNTYDVATPGDFPTWNFVYCNQGPYGTAEALLAAFEAGEVTTCPMEKDYYESTLNTMQPIAPLRDTGGDEPRIYYPSGMRLAASGYTVEWQGWSFHVSATPQRGIALYNVKFQDERIVYELMATEYAATYSSARSMHNLYYSDGGYEMGGYVVTLFEDVDCPDGAIYMPGTSGPNFGETAFEVENAICVFEAPQHYPLFRHSPGYDGYNGLPSTILIVRSIITIGNYDYVQDATFYLDGRLRMAKSASGYSLGTYNDPTVENPTTPPFGQLFTRSVTGTLHVHQAAFKVDLDVAGAMNSFQTSKMVYGSYEDAVGEMPAHIPHDGITYFEKSIQPTETSFYKDEFDFFDFVSNETNAWGEKRGYEIHPNDGIKNFYPDGHPILHQINFTKYNVAVTVRKENEFVDNGPNFCFFQPLPSPWDIGHYLDGESIVDEDLVAWVSMSKIHYPRSEDVPMPVTFSSSFDLLPHNYFDRGAYSDLPNVADIVDGCAQVETHDVIIA